MIDLAIIVEGQTEEAFVQRVLNPWLSTRGVRAWPTLSGRGRGRGGSRPWQGVRADVVRRLKERKGRRCAILFDYHGLPSDWPGRAAAPGRPVEHRARVVEAELRKDLGVLLGPGCDPRLFLPHIQLHEFEARLFSDCEVLAGVMGIKPDPLRRIIAECGGPEAIDDGATTAPSRRLLDLDPGYEKIASGVDASERMGLEAMRRACPHFASWLQQLDQLAAPA